MAGVRSVVAIRDLAIEAADGRFRHDLHYRAVAQRAALSGRRSDVLYGLPHLLRHKIRIQTHHPVHAQSILHCQQSQRGLTVHTELVKRLQVRLNAGSTTRVGARNGQCYGDHLPSA